MDFLLLVHFWASKLFYQRLADMAVHSRSSEIENAHFLAREIRSVLQTNPKKSLYLSPVSPGRRTWLCIAVRHFLVLPDELNFIPISVYYIEVLSENPGVCFLGYKSISFKIQ